MTRSFVAVVVVASWWFAADARADWHLTDSCKGESSHYFKTYEGCTARMEQYRALAPAGCSIQCEVYSNAVGSSVAPTSSFSARWRLRKKKYPWGRPAVTMDLMPVGFSLPMGGDTGSFAFGPMTVLLRATRKVSIGAHAGLLYATLDENANDRELDFVTAGGTLRVALMNGVMRAFGGYWELHVDAAGGKLWVSNPDWSGTGGFLASGALGWNFISEKLIGFGVSTRFSYGDIKVGGPMSESGKVEVKAWHVAMAHVLVGF